MIIRRRFYCSAKEILTNDWAKRNIDEAIAHAEELLENDPYRKEVAIVQIVKIVKRKPNPNIEVFNVEELG